MLFTVEPRATLPKHAAPGQVTVMPTVKALANVFVIWIFTITPLSA